MMTSKLKEIKSKLKNLNDEKIECLKSLIDVEEKFNDLADSFKSGEDWLYGLPIQSLSDLNSAEEGLVRSNLGDWKKRSSLRKDSLKALVQLEDLNNKIKLTKIDLISAKIDQVLSI